MCSKTNYNAKVKNNATRLLTATVLIPSRGILQLQYKSLSFDSVKTTHKLHPATRHTTNTLTKLSGHRFGFNNQEKDNEVAGSGNSYTAEFWQYDARLGRRWNVDPITYTWHSSYAVFNNCPIVFIDPLGLEPEGDPNKKESKTINAPLDEVVVRAKRPSWFKRMGVNFKNIVNPSDEYKAYKNAQKQETEANVKPKGEYRSYGFSSDQNRAMANFMLSATLAYPRCRANPFAWQRELTENKLFQKTSLQISGVF